MQWTMMGQELGVTLPELMKCAIISILAEYLCGQTMPCSD